MKLKAFAELALAYRYPQVLRSAADELLEAEARYRGERMERDRLLATQLLEGVKPTLAQARAHNELMALPMLGRLGGTTGRVSAPKPARQKRFGGNDREGALGATRGWVQSDLKRTTNDTTILMRTPEYVKAEHLNQLVELPRAKNSGYFDDMRCRNG